MTSRSASNPAPDRPRVVVLDDWEHALGSLAHRQGLAERLQFEVHAQTLHGQALAEALARADILLLNRDRTPLDAARLTHMPRLRYVVHTGPRNGTLELDALAARGIPVSGTAGGPSRETTTEHTFALILAGMRRLDRQLALMKEGGWRSPEPAALPAALFGSTLGLLGLGNIGVRVARVAQAFGMRVLAWTPTLTAERAAEHGVQAVPLETLLAESRVVSVHLAAKPGTHHFLDAQRLALMRPDAVLVNTSRGTVIDTQALLAALRRGRPAVAALDVYEVEPLDPRHPLRAEPNALLAPHTGFISEDSCRAFQEGAAQALLAWLDGSPLPELKTAP